jgi:hypothetical protein
MFSEFNFDKFPLVYVKLNKNVENDKDLDHFFNTWLKLYENKKHFSFIFNTLDCGLIKIKYAYAVANFIKLLKKNNKVHYLEKSILIINSKWMRYLLKTVFYVQKPISKVYIVSNTEEALSIYNSISKNEKIDESINYSFIDNK